MTRTITREDLQIRLTSTARPVLLEALPARPNNQCHVPAAVHMPLAAAGRERLGAGDPQH